MMRPYLLCTLLLLSACSRIMGTDKLGGGGGEEAKQKAEEQARSYGSDAAGLESFFKDVLTAAKKDDRHRVHDLFATLLLTAEDLQALLGPAEGRRLAPRYEGLMGAMINRGAIELCGQIYEHKYDTIDVIAIDGEASPADRALAAALVGKQPLYAVRLRKATDKLGLRYDGFVYHGGRWRTLGQLGKHLEK
jgi:hypothetical protein